MKLHIAEFKKALNEAVNEVQQKNYNEDGPIGRALVKNAGKLKVTSLVWTGYCAGTGFIPAAAVGGLLAAGFWGLEWMTKDIKK
jgi:O-acetyl-ADP-ribose deacetylase (regulator of RNase III)